MVYLPCVPLELLLFWAFIILSFFFNQLFMTNLPRMTPDTYFRSPLTLWCMNFSCCWRSTNDMSGLLQASKIKAKTLEKVSLWCPFIVGVFFVITETYGNDVCKILTHFSFSYCYVAFWLINTLQRVYQQACTHVLGRCKEWSFESWLTEVWQSFLRRLCSVCVCVCAFHFSCCFAIGV